MVTERCNSSVGPSDLINSIGVEVVSTGYTVILLITAAVFSLALYLRLTAGRCQDSVTTYLILFPSLVCLVTVLPLFSPVLFQLTSIVQDFLTVLAMLFFMNHTRDRLGGDENLVAEGSRCPLGTPPLCCLRPCARPKMTKKMMSLILLPIRLIVVLNFIVIVVNAALAYNFFPPPKDASDVGNIPSYFLIPFQVSAMYTYKVFMSYFEPRLIGTYPRTRGRLVLVVFILCKMTAGIFSVLEGNGVFESLEGLSCVKYSQLLLPVVQLGLLLPISIILPRVYTTKWSQVDQSDAKMSDSFKLTKDDIDLNVNECGDEEQAAMMDTTDKTIA